MNSTDEWYDVEAIGDGSYRIAEGVIFGSYLLVGDERALLIDSGAGVGDLRGLIDGLVDVPVTLLASHAHWDHVGNAAQFDDVVADERERDGDRLVPSGLAYGPADWVADWEAAGNSFPDGFDPRTFDVEPTTGVGTVSPGETIDIGGRELELFHVPGHSPGQLAVLDREAAVLYGADVVHNGHGLYVHFEGCDVRDYVNTFDRLIELRDDGGFETLYLSHARALAGDDLSLLEAFRDGLEAALDGELDYELIDEGVPVREYEIAGKTVLTKPDIG